jgi:hypothetical protein
MNERRFRWLEVSDCGCFLDTDLEYSLLPPQMSFKHAAIFPPSPNTARGVSTKLSASRGNIIYANGKAVIVSFRLSDQSLHTHILPDS